MRGELSQLSAADDSHHIQQHEGDPADDPMTVAAALLDFKSTLETMAAAVHREHERAAFRESIIDRLHEENQRLRHGELEALLAPVRNGLFRVHDMARKAALQIKSNPGGGAQLLEAISDECSDILIGVGVERFEAVVGELYDPARHRLVTATAVLDELKDNTIAEAQSAGFATDLKVVRRADVVLARYEASAGNEDGLK
jgi:molecular chaperone GrpE (heat shock protein)